MKSTQQNKYGLSRNIPEDVKRIIRQKCGFGCVKCGNALYQYEHIDPEFKDAKVHDPNSMTLLCGGCHELVTRGLLSKASVKKLDKNPAAKKTGFSFGPFDVNSETPEITIGSLKVQNVNSILKLFGIEIFSILEPEFHNAPFRINALFTDIKGNISLQIHNNEWLSNSKNWDVEIKGNRIIIRQKSRHIILSIRTEPPSSLIVEKLDAYYYGIKITAEENKSFLITFPNGRIFKTPGMYIKNFDSAINIDKEGNIKLFHGGKPNSEVKVDQLRFGDFS